jgi:hypothetical protein
VRGDDSKTISYHASWHKWLVFQRCLVWISFGTPAILMFHGFPQSLQRMLGDKVPFLIIYCYWHCCSVTLKATVASYLWCFPYPLICQHAREVEVCGIRQWMEEIFYIWGSHNGECEDWYLLDVQSVRMHAACSIKASVNFFQIIRCRIPKDTCPFIVVSRAKLAHDSLLFLLCNTLMDVLYSLFLSCFNICW